MAEPPSDLIIRPMQAEDVKAVGKLCKELGFSGKDAQFRDRFARLRTFPTHQSFVAHVPPVGIVGWVHVYEAPSLLSQPSAEIGGMVVKESERRRGIGGALMERAQTWAHERGCQSMLLATQVKRRGAQDFYESIGYEKEFATYFMRRALAPPTAQRQAPQTPEKMEPVGQPILAS